MYTFSTFKTLVLNELPEASSAKAPLATFLSHPAILANLPTTPASGRIRYHHAYEGGLMDHIVAVLEYMKLAGRAFASKGVAITPEDIVLTSVVHDAHKICDAKGLTYYVPNMLKKGRSEAEPFKHNDAYNASVFDARALVDAEDTTYEQYLLTRMKESGNMPCGGDCSLALVYSLCPSLYACLTPAQIFAIRFHDGAYAHSRFDSEFAGKENPLQIVLHCADMLSSREERNTINAA